MKQTIPRGLQLKVHKTDFSSVQSLTARHRNPNKILSKIYLKYYNFKSLH